MRTLIVITLVGSIAVTLMVSSGWPFDTTKLNVLFSGLGFVALVATLLLQQRAIADQQKQIDTQQLQTRFTTIVDLIEEPVKRYWSMKEVSQKVMILLVSRHLAGLESAIDFIKDNESQSTKKVVLDHVYEPQFLNWAKGNKKVLDQDTLQCLDKVVEYYGL